MTLSRIAEGLGVLAADELISGFDELMGADDFVGVLSARSEQRLCLRRRVCRACWSVGPSAWASCWEMVLHSVRGF